MHLINTALQHLFHQFTKYNHHVLFINAFDLMVGMLACEDNKYLKKINNKYWGKLALYLMSHTQLAENKITNIVLAMCSQEITKNLSTRKRSH